MLQFEVVTRLASRGHEAYEDAAGVTRRNAWVVDGSTGFDAPRLDPVSDARWLASSSSERLATVFANDESALPTDALRAVVDALHAGFVAARPPFDIKPSAAIALCHLDRDHLMVLRLGDVFAFGPSSRPDTVQAYEAGLKRELQRITKGDLSDDARLAERMRVVRRERMNVEGGYWTLSDEPAAIEHAEIDQADVAAGDRMLLCSDGFARIVAWFGILSTWQEVIEALENGQADRLIAELRRREDDDPRLRNIPTVTRHDDATALVLKVVEGDKSSP